MGTDKALIPFATGTLATHVAAEVLAATGCVTLVGDRDRYSHLGFPVIPDRSPGNGPLGGVAAAVAAAREWALVVACDMPGVTRELLSSLVDAAVGSKPGIECVVPESMTGPEPLCAAYHHRSLPLLDSFLDHKFLKMKEVVLSLQTLRIPVGDASFFRNLNTPEDIRAHE